MDTLVQLLVTTLIIIHILHTHLDKLTHSLTHSLHPPQNVTFIEK